MMVPLADPDRVWRNWEEIARGPGGTTIEVIGAVSRALWTGLSGDAGRLRQAGLEEEDGMVAIRLSRYGVRILGRYLGSPGSSDERFRLISIEPHPMLIVDHLKVEKPSP